MTKCDEVPDPSIEQLEKILHEMHNDERKKLCKDLPGISFTTCFRQTTCYDCDNESCLHHGYKGADCPKYHCDNPNGVQNCENCEFIDDFIGTMGDEWVYTERKRQEE